MEDYDSKVNKLLNNFSTDEMEIDDLQNTNNLNDIPTQHKIEFTLEKNNDNVLVNLTNDERYLIQIKKDILNFNLGDEILEYFKKELNYKKNLIDPISNIKKEKVIQTITKSNETKKIMYTNPTKKNNLFSTNKLDELNQILNSKIPKLKISYKDYFYNSPKCDLCEMTGVTIEELNKTSNRQYQIDALVLDYILYQCNICKVNLHSSCATDEKFPKKSFSNLSGLNMNTDFLCKKCQNEIEETCQICYKKDSQLKQPHYYKNVDNTWIHNWCLIWFIYDQKENLSFSQKLKQFYLSNSNNSICDICQDSNTK